MPHARFSVLIPFWALSHSFLRVARDPTGAKDRLSIPGEKPFLIRTADLNSPLVCLPLGQTEVLQDNRHHGADDHACC